MYYFALFFQLFNFQLIDGKPCCSSKALVFEKCLHPENALPASGDGCAASSTKCFAVSIRYFLDRAKFPHNKNITPRFSSDILQITASVNVSQPILLCEVASLALTVSIEFNMNTPCSAHFSKQP